MEIEPSLDLSRLGLYSPNRAELNAIARNRERTNPSREAHFFTSAGLSSAQRQSARSLVKVNSQTFAVAERQATSVVEVAN